jgi:phage host-nuclease inhibitor protein Gam
MRTITSREQAVAHLKQIAHLTGLLGCAAAMRDQDVLAAQKRHSGVIEALAKDIKEREALLEQWARENRAQEFGESQTLQLPDGKLCFRKGQRKLELLEGWTWQSTLEKLCSFDVASQWAEYVRREPQIDAERLLADTKGEMPRLAPARLGTIGLQIVRGEKFHVEPRPGPACFEDVPN